MIIIPIMAILLATVLAMYKIHKLPTNKYGVQDISPIVTGLMIFVLLVGLTSTLLLGRLN